MRPADPQLFDLLAAWLPVQRWWPAKGRPVDFEVVGRLRFAPPGAGIDVQTLLLAVDGPTSDVVQAPLTCRSAPEPGLGAALVGRVEEGWVYDGAHDPAFVAAWLRLLAGDGEVGDGQPGGGRVRARGVRFVGARVPPPDSPARVLTGEQSNTSIVLERAGVIVKLFRVVRPGENPDVVVTSALATGGCARVPRPVGWVEGTWPGPGGHGTVGGHLGYACEFLAGGEDGWRAACRAAAAGASFAAEAAGIAAATADVHATLAATLPSAPLSAPSLARLVDHLRGRLAWAVAAVPALSGVRAGAEDLYDRLGGLAIDPARAPLWQRVHGDLHLGQVLHAPGRGWVLVDFEGEPLTPLAERNRPDLALRDVAGMLRSFDYAARHEAEALPAASPAAAAAARWADDCRTAFLRAYRAAAHPQRSAPSSPWEDMLLRAFEVDKALYEVVYETWNRPHWVSRPLAALRRVLAG